MARLIHSKSVHSRFILKSRFFLIIHLMLYYTFDVFSSIIFVIISSVFLCHKRHCIEVTIVIPDDDITNLVFDINLIPTSTINQHDKNENLRHRDKFVLYRSHKNVINFISYNVILSDISYCSV